MFDVAKWFRKTFRRDARFTQRPQFARRRKTPLRLEWLEDRLVPTIVFQPQFGAEQTFYDKGPVLSDAPVYLLFWGSYWNTSAGSASEQQYVNAINKELNSPIFNNLSQYKDTNGNAAGPAYLWGSTPTGGNPVYWNATETHVEPTNYFSDTQLQNVVAGAIDDPNSPIYPPSTIESIDGGHEPIYFVITPPGVYSSNGPYTTGYHSDFNTTLHFGGYQNIVYGWSANENDALGTSYSPQDLVTLMVSHEIGEALTDPENSAPKITVGLNGYNNNPGPNYHGPGVGTTGEIGDYEPEFEGAFGSYSYRLNGSLTQALWDYNAQAFTVSDGTSQNFYVVPQYNSLGAYIGNELDIKGDQQGSGSDDTVEVFTATNGGLMVYLNGETVIFDPGQITSLHIATGGGSNSISVLSTPQGLTTSIDCEGSNDTVNVGNYVPDTGGGSGFLEDLKGAVSVSGGGTYHLNVDDTGELFGQLVSISKSGTGVGQIIVGGAAPITYSGAGGSLTVFGSRGGDTFNVHDTTGLPTSIDTGAGNDTVNVYATTDNLSINNTGGNDSTFVGLGNTGSIKGSVSVFGSGTSALVVDDHLDSTSRKATLTSTQLTGLGNTGVIYYWGDVTSLAIDGGAGNNTFNISNGNPNSSLNVPVTVNGGAGNDTFNVGAGNLDYLADGVTVNGGGGSNTVIVNDKSAPYTDTYTITGSTISRPFFGGLTYNGVQAVTLNGESGGNTYNVSDTASGTTYTLNGGAGSDTFNLSNGILDSVAGAVKVNGGGGSNTVFLNDQDAWFTDTYTITNSTISRPFFAGLSYSGVKAVILDGESGGNVYNVNSTAAGTTYSLNAGAGNDTFNIGAGNLNSLAGAVTVNGGSGSNTAVINDNNDASTDPYTITYSTVSRPSFAGLTYSSLGSLTLNGESGGNVYNVNSTASGTAYTLNGGTGKNTLVGPNSGSSTATLTGFAAAGVGPGETNNLYVGFTSSNVPGVSITKITFDTTAENVYLNPYGTGVGASNNGVGSYTLFPAEPPIFPPETVSVFGLNTSGFGPGASLFDANFNLQALSGSMALPSNLQGATVTVNFSDGLTATTTLTTTLQGSNSLGSYDDVEGIFTVTGPSGLSTPVNWTLSSANAGSVGNVSFNHFGNLTGGTGSDTFNLGASGSVSGIINGGGGTNTLNYAGHSTAVTINLQSHTATATGGFSNINTLAGGSGSTTLVGPNTANTWNLTGANAGNLNGTVKFTGVGNLTGGTAMDVFKLSNGASVSGVLSGGGGGDWLDYASYTSAIAVNLATGTASHTGGISNIQNVRAGSGGSTLTGNAQGNILVGGAGVDTIQGGSGRSLLIGGGGADHVTGSSGDDIVIGGTTSYSSNDLALMSILAEWQSGNSYAVRLSHLKLGGGLNGSNKLVFGTTVHDDGAANILSGGAGMDWFFKGAHDTITDLQSGEQVN
jgi:hypothetical protein